MKIIFKDVNEFVADSSDNGMMAFSPVKLGQAVIFIVNIIKQIQRFVNVSHFNDYLNRQEKR